MEVLLTVVLRAVLIDSVEDRTIVDGTDSELEHGVEMPHRLGMIVVFAKST